ncbi:MAG: 2-amino-4-hydroxy-6-hydroxymethyldihydropteridine diphosphokinase [Acidiferrobacterales bacterium]
MAKKVPDDGAHKKKMPESGKSVVVYIGLGSNMGDSVTILQTARNALAALPETTLQRCASLYKSAPIGTVEQPDFINSVCSLATTLAAPDLLHRLLEIEQKFGRQRSGSYGEPRTLDLDLLLYGDRSMNTAQLTLPHPGLHERAFVLYPLSEIAPDLVIPGRGPVVKLLRNCQHQRIERLVDSESRSR